MKRQLMQCPACPVKLQPLEPTSSYVEKAIQYATERGVEPPPHGPAAVVMLSLVAHAQLCHPERELDEYLEAYLDS